MGEWSRAEVNATRERLLAGLPAEGLADLLTSTSAGDGPRDDARLLGRLMPADRIFVVRPPDAPGLFFAGATVAPDPDRPPRSFTGTGTDIRSALARLGGEIAEFRARLSPSTIESPDPGDPVRVAELTRRDPTLEETGPGSGWVYARDVGRPGPDVVLPSGWFYATAPDPPATGGTLGSGIAAAPQENEAVVASALELIERDATALWWFGGNSAPVLRFTGPAAREIGAFVDAVRAGAKTRYHRFLDLRTDIGLPTVAALSVAKDGTAAAWGLATRTTTVAAAKAAFRELCQIECGHRLIELKRMQRGAEALTASDRDHLHTAKRLATYLQSMPGSLAERDVGETGAEGSAAERMATIRDALTRRGLAWYTVRLSAAEDELAVAKSVVPGLQTMDPERQTERLRLTISRTGGSNPSLRDCNLI